MAQMVSQKCHITHMTMSRVSACFTVLQQPEINESVEEYRTKQLAIYNTFRLLTFHQTLKVT